MKHSSAFRQEETPDGRIGMPSSTVIVRSYDLTDVSGIPFFTVIVRSYDLTDASGISFPAQFTG